MNTFLRFKPSAIALRLSLSHVPGLGFLSSPSGAEETAYDLKDDCLDRKLTKLLGIYWQSRLSSEGLTYCGQNMYKMKEDI